MLSKEVKHDLRSRRTRQFLLDALKGLLGEKEFRKITVEDIATRAQVNRATFYAHFNDKYELLNYSVQQDIQTMLAKRLPAEPTFTAANLRILAEVVFEFMGQFIDHCMPPRQDTDTPLMVLQVQAAIRETLLEWANRLPALQGQVTSPRDIAAVASWVIFGSAMDLMMERSRQTPAQLADRLMPLLTDGLSAYLQDSATTSG